MQECVNEIHFRRLNRSGPTERGGEGLDLGEVGEEGCCAEAEGCAEESWGEAPVVVAVRVGVLAPVGVPVLTA
jgi:hypothetical protein